MPVANVTRRVRYFVSDSSAAKVLAIDEFTNDIVQNFTVGIRPMEVVSDRDGNVYVANALSDTVTIICLSGTTRTITAANNGFIDVDILTGRLYASNTNSVGIYDVTSGALIFTITDSFTSTGVVKLNNSANRLLVADGNVLKIYSTITFDLITSITLNNTINDIVINSKDTKAFVSFGPSPKAGIAIIDLTTNSFMSNITSPSLTAPFGLAIKGNILYVTNNLNPGTIVVIDTTINSVIGAPIPVGINPVRIAVSPDDTLLYVTNNGDGTVSVINTSTLVVQSIFIGPTAQPFGITGIFFGSLISPGDPINLRDPYQIDDIKESVCILTRKVFAHCQNRSCFPNITKDLPPCTGPLTFAGITFSNAVIASELRTPLPDRPNFDRVQMVIRVPYTIRYRTHNGNIITDTGFLPDIAMDIVLFIPDSRDEFTFDIVVESRSELLNTPTIEDSVITFTAGVFMVIKVVGEVQLLVPAFGYCPEPPECEEFEEPEEEDMCKVFLDFTQTPFPEDFFPPQLEEVQCINRN